jgi:hypothetical protein
MKKYIYITLFAFTLLGLLVAYNPDLRTIGADSGWDSSYSSSDHSSSSRSDRDSSSSYADDILSDFGLIEDIIFEVIIFITFTIIIIKILNKDILVFSINIVRTIIVILFEILVSPKMIYFSLFSMALLILVVAFYCMKKKDDPYKFINNYTKCSDEVLKKAGITIYTTEDIKKYGIEKIFNDAIKIVTDGTQGFHLSIDTDVIDPKIAPGVSVPEVDGISEAEFNKMIAEFMKYKEIIKSIDFVEYNPKFDVDKKTLKIVTNSMNHIINAL